MEHLEIAYDLFVIMIGLAALSIVVFWAVRTGESDLRDFSILYSCFTLILVVVVLKKYLFLNVDKESVAYTKTKQSFYRWLRHPGRSAILYATRAAMQI
jgi:hypothetical protein